MPAKRSEIHAEQVSVLVTGGCFGQCFMFVALPSAPAALGMTLVLVGEGVEEHALVEGFDPPGGVRRVCLNFWDCLHTPGKLV